MKRYAFLDWPKPEAGDTPRAWQDDRCAVCGEEGRVVLDHDHDTALCRGFLCRGCNISEGKGSALFEDWRVGVNPYDMYFEPELYYSPAHGFEIFDPTGEANRDAYLALDGDERAMERVIARQREYVYPIRRAGGIVYPAPDEDLDAMAEAATRGF